MLPYRKCQTWELPEKTKASGPHIGEGLSCCVTTAVRCRVSAEDSSGSGGASSPRCGVHSPFFPGCSSGELLAAAAVEAGAAAENAPEVADVAFCHSAAAQGSSFRETAAIGFRTHRAVALAGWQSSAEKPTLPTTSVTPASAANLSVTLSDSYRRPGSPPQRCCPVLRKYRSFDSWLSPPALATFSSPWHSWQQQRQQRSAASAAEETAAAECEATKSTSEDNCDAERQQLSPEVATVPRPLTALGGGSAARAAAGAGGASAERLGITSAGSAGTCVRDADRATESAAAAAGPARDASTARPTAGAAAVSESGDFNDKTPSFSETSGRKHSSSGTPWYPEGNRNDVVGHWQRTQLKRPYSDSACEVPTCEPGEAAAPVGADKGHGEVLVPLLQRQQLQQEPQAPCKVRGGQRSPTCLSADTVQPTRETENLSKRATAVSDGLPATAAAVPHTKKEAKFAAAGTESGDSCSVICAREVAAGNSVDEDRNSNLSDSGGECCELPPSSASSFSHRESLATSEMSGPSEVLSEDEQAKINFFRSLGMTVPAASRRKGNFCSNGRKRNSSASTPAAYDSFSSTSPESVYTASVHSVSLPHSASLVTLPISPETASEESWWASGNVNSSSISRHRRSGTIPQWHQGGLKMPLRSLSYTLLTADQTIKSEKQGAQQHVCEQEPEQDGRRPSGTRCRVVSRSLCSSFCSSTAEMRQSEQQQRREREDGKQEEGEEDLQQDDEDARQQRGEHETTVQQQQPQGLTSDEKEEARYQGGASAEQLLSENWRRSVLNSSEPGSCSTPAVYSREGSHRGGGVACRKRSHSDVGRGLAATAVTLPRKKEELRRTMCLANEREALACLGVPLTVRHTAQQTLIAAVTFLSADEATSAAAEEATTPGTSPAEGFLARPLAPTVRERHEETRSTGVTQETTVPVQRRSTGGRNRGEAPSRNAAGECHTIDGDPPAYDQLSASATMALDNEAKNKRCNISSARERGMRRRQSCDRAVQDRSETLPPIATDSMYHTDNVSFSENVTCSPQRAIATWNTPIVQSPAPVKIADVRDVHLTAKEGSGSGVEGPGCLPSCSRSAASSASGLPSALVSASDIPTIHLCTAQDTDDRRESRGASALSRTQQTVPAAVVQGSESTVDVSVGSRDDRWRPVPSINFCRANSTGIDDLPRTPTDVFPGSEARYNSAETRLLTRAGPLSPRGGRELLSATEHRSEGLYDGSDTKKTPGSAGTTPLMYGRYLGVADISGGQGIASPSTLSTASPYSCSGFSSSYSLPSSSTPVLGSQLYASGAASLISPSPAGTLVEDAFLTASSSPSVVATGTAGGEASAFTPSSVDSPSHSNSPRPSPAPSNDESAATSSVTRSAVARSRGSSNEAVDEAAADAARSAGVSAFVYAGSGKCATVSVTPAVDTLAGVAAPAGRGNPGGNEVGSTLEAGQYVSGSAASSKNAPVPTSAAVRAARADTIARGSSREMMNEDATSRMIGHTNNSTSEGEQNEGSGRQKSTWKLSMRKMFSSKSLLRWKNAVGAVTTKQQEATQGTMNPDSASSSGHQRHLPEGKNVSADDHAGFRHRDAASSAAAASGSLSVPAVTPVRSHVAADSRARYTTEGPPSENRAISVETTDILQKPSNSADRNSSTGKEEISSLVCSSPIAQDIGKGAQMTPRQDARHDQQDALQQKDGHRRAVSSTSPLDEQHAREHQNLIPKQQALLQYQEEDPWKGYGCRKELQTEHYSVNCEGKKGGTNGSQESGLGDRRNELICQGGRENDFSAGGGWMPVSHLRDNQQLDPCENKRLEGQSQRPAEEQAVRSKHLREIQVSPPRVLQSQGEHHRRAPQEVKDWLFCSTVRKQQKERGEQQLLGVEQQQECQRGKLSTYGQGRGGGCEQLPAEEQRETEQRDPRKTGLQCAIERLQKELPGRRKQLQSKAVLQQSRTLPLSESLDVLQRSGWVREQEDQEVWVHDQEEQRVAESAVFAVEVGSVPPIGRSPCVSRRETLPGVEGSSSPWTSNVNLPVLSRSLSSPLSLSPSSSTGGSASPTPAVEDLSQLSGAMFPSGRRSSCRRHGATPAGAGASVACAVFGGMHNSSATSPVTGETGQTVRRTVAARAGRTAENSAALCAPQRPMNRAAWNRTIAAEARETGGRHQAPEGGTGRLTRSQSSYAVWRVPGTRQMSCDGDAKRMYTRSAVAEDVSQSCASYSVLTPSDRVHADAQTSENQSSGYELPARGPERASLSKETLLCLDVSSGVYSSDSRRNGQHFSDDQQRLMRTSQEDRTLYASPLSTLAASASARTEATMTSASRDGHSVAVGVDAEHPMVQEENQHLTAPALPHGVTTHTAVPAVPTTTAPNGFFHWRETPEVGICSTSPSALRGRRGKSASAAPVVEAERSHGVTSTDGTRPPAGPRAAGLNGGTAPEKNSLKREKELTALAFIRDRLNASTPRSQRRGLPGGRCRRCGCTGTESGSNLCSGGEECIAHRVSASPGLLCSPSGVCVPTCAADEIRHTDATAAEGGAPRSSGETRTSMKQPGAIHRVATLGTPGDFYSQRSPLHMSPNRRSWPHLPAAAGITQRVRPVEQAQVASEFSRSLSTHEQEVIDEQPPSSGTETGLQHHIRRFLHLWADGEQIQRSDSSGSLECETAARGDGGGREGHQQHQQSRATRHTLDGGGQAVISLRHSGPVAVSNPGYVCARDNSCRSCGAPSFSADVHGTSIERQRMCYGDGSDASSRRRCSSSGRHRSISLHATAHGRLPSGHDVTLRQCKSEHCFHRATPVQVRRRVEDTLTHVAAAESASALSFSHAARTSAAEALTHASPRAGGCNSLSFPASVERSGAAVDSEVLSAAAAESASKDVAALLEKTDHHCGTKLTVGSAAVCPNWKVEDDGAFVYAVSPPEYMTRTSPQQSEAAVRRSSTAVQDTGAAGGTAYTAAALTGSILRAPVATSAEAILRRKEAELTSSDLAEAVALAEDTASSRHQLRLRVQDHRLLEKPHTLQDNNTWQQPQGWQTDDECQDGVQQSMQKREGLDDEQCWHRHPEQQQWSAWHDQRLTAAAGNKNADDTISDEHETHLGQQERNTSLRASLSPSAAASPVFGGAGLQSFLVFPRKETEDSYCQQLSSVFSIRLRVVGVALVFLHVLHLVWGILRTASHLQQRNVAESRIAAAGDAAQLGLYAALCLGSRLHRNKVSLETWTCVLFSLAFAARFCALVATLFLGRAASQLFVAENSSAAADDGLLASYISAVSYQLVRLSLCCIFHVLVCGMMLPARTLICLPMHAFHFGGCLIATGAAATCTHLSLDPDGPVCALSSCLYTVLGFICQAQLEASQRQLYVRWKKSQKGLQDMRRRRKQRSLSSTDLTGVEQVAMLVRQSQMLLRDAVDGGNTHSREGFFEQLASLQKQILEIVTDVRSMYNEQKGKGEIYELLNFVPEGQVVEPPVATRMCRRQETYPCRQPTCIDRSWWRRQQSECLLSERAETETRAQEGAGMSSFSASEAVTAADGPAVSRVAEGALNAAAAATAAVQAAPATAHGLTREEGQLFTTARREGTAGSSVLEECVDVTGERGGDHDRSCQFLRSSGINSSYTQLFEADLEEWSVVRETLEKMQRAASNRQEEILQEPTSAVVELIRRVGIEWDVDFFEVDEYTEGNTLRLTGELQLSPLVRPDGLQCEMRVLRRFLHCLQRQYRVTNPYHNQLHAAMVSHCCLVLVGECLPSRDALTYNDEICLCVAALAHDIGHPGLTNQYLINCQSLLATTYNDIAVLENYHAACCFRTASHCEDLNIFGGLSKDIYAYMRQNIIGLILATDMSKHISYISRLRVRSEAGNFNPATSADRWLFFQACMKAADLAHTATSWGQHKRWSELLCEEFYRQGDEERRQGLPVVETFDRKMAFRFPQSQYRFICVVVEPLLEAIMDVEALLQGRGGVRTVICRHVVNNRRRWRRLAIAAGVGSPAEKEDDTEDEHEVDNSEEKQKGEQLRTLGKNKVYPAGER